MSFNAGKCKVIHFGKNNHQFNYTMGGHAPGGQVLEKTTEEKDVGVMVSKNLKPSAQCVKAAKKANQVLGQMSRGLHYRDKHTWIRLYKQYVLPHMDYCSQAWSPWFQKDIELLESVQARAVRMVSGLKSKTYPERLKEVGLTSLEVRRVRGDMIQVWKTLHQKDDVLHETWFTPALGQRLGSSTRSTSDMWNLKRSVPNYEERRNFWSIRSVDPWNSLPAELKMAETLNAFKNGNDKLNLA